MEVPKYSPITIIEGNRKADWEQKHTSLKERLSKVRVPQANHHEKVLAAETRRGLLQKEIVNKVMLHHARVRAVSSGKKRPAHAESQSRHSAAQERREKLQRERKQKVVDHHEKVRSTVLYSNSKSKLATKQMSQRHAQAEERRRTRLTAQKKLLQQHTQKIDTAREKRRQKGERNTKKAKDVIASYKLDSSAIEDASFDEIQRVLMSRSTMTRAKDLLHLISTSFEKVLAEEKTVITDETPVGMSPSKSAAGKVPCNPRIFLSAYICMGGLTPEGYNNSKPGPLEQAVQNHAGALIAALEKLLGSLEDDSNLDDQETKTVMKSFAKEWAAYEASFEAWKKKDHKELLEHYISTYSEVERGRVDIISETAAKGSRRPEEHAELMTSIEESLRKIRAQIEGIGGERGIEELTARLQVLYDTHQITPVHGPTASASSPVMSDVESTPKTSPVPAPSASTPPPQQPSHQTPEKQPTTEARSPASTSPRSPTSQKEIDNREKLQNMLLKAKMAHDTIFNTSKDAGSDEEEPGMLTVKMIKKAAEKAFWDILVEELQRSPPATERLGSALQGLTELLLQVTPRKMKDALQVELKDCVDWDLLKHSLSYDTLASLVVWFTNKIMELEAPAENEVTKAETEEILAMIQRGGPMHTVVVPALKFLHDKLESLIKAIHEARKTLIGPLLAKDAEDLIRGFYQEEVAQNLHNFEDTKQWLLRTLNKALPLTAQSRPEDLGFALPLTVEDVMTKSNKLYTTIPRLALLHAIMFPKNIEGDSGFPEALRLHRDLLRRYADKVQLVTLTAAISGLAGQLSGQQKVLKPVADEVSEMLSTPGIKLPAIIDQVVHVVDREIGKPIPEATRKLLVGMLGKVANTEDKVFVTYHHRLLVMVSQLVICGPQNVTPIQQTPFAHLVSHVQDLTFCISRLTALNLKWLRPFYDPLLSSIVEDIQKEKDKAMQTGEL